jgi:DNA polymerase-3 subunit delta
MSEPDLSAPVHLLKGADEVLLNEAAHDLVHRLVGDDDRSLVVDEVDAARFGHDDTPDISVLVDAAQTPPFLTARRVVVGRHLGMFGTKDAVAPIVDYLSDPLDTTTLVLVWERPPKTGARLPAVPRSLSDAVQSAGGVVMDTNVAERGRKDWIDDHVDESGLKLDREARARLADRLGGDPGRLRGVLEALVSTYGAGARLDSDDVEPYLGEGSDVQPWDLTDAIDAGDIALALERLHRMTGAGGRHPLQVMAVLHNHYARLLRLDGSGVRGEKDAAELLGMKGRSTFAAKKALEQSRRLGSDRLRSFIALLAEADLDLRGAKAWPDELVMEVLVARLAGRSRAGTTRARATRSSR